jgi:sugar/nucleoside kinase (ribokinase family)
MILVLGDLLADYSLRVPDLGMRPQELQRVSYLELGPGGATNVAITARRLGLSVGCLGEVGDDLFGQIVRRSLDTEAIDISGIIVTQGARTPVANVLIDERGEPAYLGFPGSLQLRQLPDAWRPRLAQAQALFCDGWVEYEDAANIILQAFDHCRSAGVPVFFDPGPGNPHVDNAWQREAAAMATVLLATEGEARRLSEESDPLASGQRLLSGGAQIVIVKRGVAGCLLFRGDDVEIVPGFPVEARDATGAGDSFAGAAIYAYLHDFSLPQMGTLGNAAGAAKVQKLGTGLNMPTPGEIEAVLARLETPLQLSATAKGRTDGVGC